MTKRECAFDREWEAITAEYRERAAETKERLGVAVAYPEDGFEQAAARESARADRLMMAAAREFANREEMRASEFERLVGMTGRVYGPRVLHLLDQFAALRPKAYARVVPYAWSLAEFPGLTMPRADWRALWKKAGFVIDGKSAQRPAEPIRLWRGATRAHKGGMAWTEDRAGAQWFVDHRHRQGFLWTAVVPPQNLLVRIHETGRHESEWIVDTRGVEITLASD